jgi:hypothetical protein
VADDEDGQLSALERDARLVTLTVGAANLGLSVVLACSNPNTPEECQRQINRALALLRDCPEDKNSLVLDCSLTPLYAQVAREARGARIVVTGYPLLFESPAPGDPRAAINQPRLVSILLSSELSPRRRPPMPTSTTLTWPKSLRDTALSPPSLTPTLSFIANSPATRPARIVGIWILRLFTRLPPATRPMPTRSRPHCQPDG